MRGGFGRSSQAQIRKQNKLFWRTVFTLILFSVIAFLFSISAGRAGIILSFEKANGYEQFMRILYYIRIPRACASFVIGAGLSVSGIVYQSVFNNKLVSPGVLGVSSGCCVGAAVAIFLNMSAAAIKISAFIFGTCSVFLAVLLPKLFKNRSVLTLVLSGIIISSLMDSVLALIKYAADRQEKLADIIFWIMGCLAGIQLDEVFNSFMLSLIPFAVLIIMGRHINVISLGAEEAQSLGLDYKKNRLIIIACATLLTSNCVSVSGNVGWVGLVIPHIARAFVGEDSRKSIPVSALCGGLFLLIVDTLSRLISINEIPLSIITGFLGALIYTIVLIRKGRYIDE